MNGRRSSRRSFLGTVLGGLALLSAGRRNGALADKNLGHGDKATFESSCDQYGGEFIDSPKDKLTVCVWSNGGKTVCDQDGNDCTNYDPPKPKPIVNGGIADPFGGFGGVATTEIIEAVETTPASDATTPDVADEAASISSGKQRRRRGKRNKNKK